MKRKFRGKRRQLGIFQRRCTIRKGFIGRELPPEDLIRKSAEGEKLEAVPVDLLLNEASLDSPCNMLRGDVHILERALKEEHGVPLSVIREPDRLTQEIREINRDSRRPWYDLD